MINPFEGYRVTSLYGWRSNPFGAGKEFHTGIDLVKYHKAPIHAFSAGEVMHAKLGVTGSGFGNYGNVVAIKDSKGSLQVYAHLDSCTVKVGEEVTKGQVIGYQGSTGRVTGSHLHFEVRKKCSPSFGWIADRANNCYEPTNYLRDFEANNTSKTTSKPKGKNIGKRVYLPKTDETWRIYDLNVEPVKKNAKKEMLKPKKFGGLDYKILDNPYPDVYTIQTSDYSKVNIYAAPSTGAKIKSE